MASRSPSRRTVRRRGKRRSWFWRYRRLLFLVALLFVTGLAGVAYVLFQVPLPPPPSLDELSQTTFITDVQGRPLAELRGAENRVLKRIDQIPELLQQAVVATEDRNFFEHKGIDPVGLARATWSDLRNRTAKQGGSTITQQYVKSTYVGRERSVWRKLKEAVISVKLERKIDKTEILERYLNTIYFGRGAYGVQAASQAYFGKDVDQLALGEAAYLAGLIRSPERADASRDAAEAARRRRLTLRAMQEEGYISAAERDEAAAVAIDSVVRPRPGNVLDAQVTLGEKGTPYFVEHVRRYLEQRYGTERVHAGGLRVRTTLDLDLQAAAYDAVYGLLDRADDPAGALVAVDDQGRVLAMVGGRDWNASKVNLATGTRGGGGGRQGGSAFKPFVLAEVVRQGFTLESALPAPASIVLPKANDGKDWRVSNYEGQEFGRLNLIDATAQSANTVYAQLVTEVGAAEVVELAHRLGIDSKLNPVPSITLGTQNVSALEMAEAYLSFATRGEHVADQSGEPLVVTEVTDADGDVIERIRPRRERVLEPAQADMVTYALQQVVEKGSGVRAAFGSPVAGKTGTTENHGDAWFVGYTPRLSVSVWMGYPEGQARPMLNVHGRKVSGGVFPAAIFRRFMTAVEGSGKVDLGGKFTKPSRFAGKLLSSDRIGVGESATTSTMPSSTTSSTAPATATTGVTAPTASTTTSAPRPARTTTTPPPPPPSAPPPSTTAVVAPPPTNP